MSTCCCILSCVNATRGNSTSLPDTHAARLELTGTFRRSPSHPPPTVVTSRVAQRRRHAETGHRDPCVEPIPVSPSDAATSPKGPIDAWAARSSPHVATVHYSGLGEGKHSSGAPEPQTQTLRKALRCAGHAAAPRAFRMRPPQPAAKHIASLSASDRKHSVRPPVSCATGAASSPRTQQGRLKYCICPHVTYGP